MSAASNTEVTSPLLNVNRSRPDPMNNSPHNSPPLLIRPAWCPQGNYGCVYAVAESLRAMYMSTRDENNKLKECINEMMRRLINCYGINGLERVLALDPPIVPLYHMFMSINEEPMNITHAKSSGQGMKEITINGEPMNITNAKSFGQGMKEIIEISDS